jgi:hypothetical protein
MALFVRYSYHIQQLTLTRMKTAMIILLIVDEATKRQRSPITGDRMPIEDEPPTAYHPLYNQRSMNQSTNGW